MFALLFRPLAKARSVSPMTPFARSTLALVFLWYAVTHNEARAHALDEGLKHLARELGVVIHHQHVREAVAGAEAHVADDLCRPASAAVAVARVGTACTLPDSRSTWF